MRTYPFYQKKKRKKEKKERDLITLSCVIARFVAFAFAFDFYVKELYIDFFA